MNKLILIAVIISVALFSYSQNYKNKKIRETYRLGLQQQAIDHVKTELNEKANPFIKMEADVQYPEIVITLNFNDKIDVIKDIKTQAEKNSDKSLCGVLRDPRFQNSSTFRKNALKVLEDDQVRFTTIGKQKGQELYKISKPVTECRWFKFLKEL